MVGINSQPCLSLSFSFSVLLLLSSSLSVSLSLTCPPSLPPSLTLLYLSLSPLLSVSNYLPVSVSFSVPFSFALHLSVCLCLSCSLHLCLSVPLSFPPFTVPLHLSFPHSFICVPLSLLHTLSLSLVLPSLFLSLPPWASGFPPGFNMASELA